MVFQKLTDTDKEQLAIFGQEHDKKQVSAMRALIMRGATPNEARTMAIERENARNELVEAMAKEMQQKEEEEAKVVPETKVKAKRAPRKAKAVPGAETDVEAEPEPTAPPPSPKLKRTRSKKVKESAEQLVNETPNQITILA
jgi:hypothetical protein